MKQRIREARRNHPRIHRKIRRRRAFSQIIKLQALYKGFYQAKNIASQSCEDDGDRLAKGLALTANYSELAQAFGRINKQFGVLG